MELSARESEMGGGYGEWLKRVKRGGADIKEVAKAGKKHRQHTHTHTYELRGKVRATRKAEENGGIKLNYNKRQAKNELTTTTKNYTTYNNNTKMLHTLLDGFFLSTEKI